MSIVLRDYQSDLIYRTREAMRRHRAVLLQAPTGAGKTALSAHMLGTAQAKGLRCAFINHRVELIEQSALTFQKVGIPYGIIAAGFDQQPWARVQICSIDTLRSRLSRTTAFDFIVWDECHHVAAKTWGSVMAAFPGARHVGLTATPERLDGKGLEKYFQALVEGPKVRWLIDNGFLCDYRAYAPSAPDLSGIKAVAGDFNKGQLGEAMSTSTVVGDAVSHYQRYAAGKRAVMFCVSIKHSQRMVEAFRARGISAVHIDGQMPRGLRASAIADFRAGRIDVLSNVDLISEGFDLPAMEAVILLRPTQSLGLYLQQVGRSLRTDEGKSHAVILDHAGNIARHGLPCLDRPWSLQGKAARKKREAEVPIKQCPACFHVHAPRPTCPNCGHLYEVQPRQLEEVEGTLKEVDLAAERERQAAMNARRRQQGQARELDDLIRLARRRGYRNPEGWAAHVMSARTARKRAG
jgi:superfamily II DNA or RNA helicase